MWSEESDGNENIVNTERAHLGNGKRQYAVDRWALRDMQRQIFAQMVVVCFQKVLPLPIHVCSEILAECISSQRDKTEHTRALPVTLVLPLFIVFAHHRIPLCCFVISSYL